MLLSFVVYFSTLGIMWLLLSSKKSNLSFLGLNANIFIALLYYSLIMGMRYGVGADFFQYLRMYNQAQIGEFDYQYLSEPAYYWITSTLAHYKFHSSFFFGAIAFIQAYFLALSFKDNKRLLKYIILAFFALQFLSFMNVLRQSISLAIFIYAIKYIVERKPIHYYLLAILSAMFHKSGFLLLVAYPVLIIDWHQINRSILVQLGLFFSSVFISLGDHIEDLIFNKFGIISTFLKYDSYVNFTITLDDHKSVGYVLHTILSSLLILNSNKAMSFFKDTRFATYYILFFVGSLWANFVFPSMYLARPNLYMFGTRFIVCGYILYYLRCNINASLINKIMFTAIICILVLLIFAQIIKGDENTFRYLFCWMEHLDSYHYTNKW